MFSHMLIFSNIKILEHWFKMDSFDNNSFSVFIQNTINTITFCLSHWEILSSCKSSVFCCNWSYSSHWVLLNTISSESTINAVAECFIVYHKFWIICLVFMSHLIKFLFCEIEVKHWKNLLKLIFGNLSSS